MKGLKLRTVVGLFCLVLCAAGVLVAHVWKQNAYVRLSMSAVKIGKQRAQLRNDIALLEISVGGLKRLSRIEGMARGRFGLEYGNTPVLVYLDGDAAQDRGGSAPAPEAGTGTAGVAGKPGEAGRAGAAARDDGTGRTKAPEAVARAEADAEGKGLEAGKVAWRIKGF
ncbi:MAG TPA: hypothetical protein VJ385_17120 [Fibrobacteria bacterium]|nr:hypothetical protein [Fibrobacteria bacterium]